MMQKAYIALGGNLEDPVAAFTAYLQHISLHPDIVCTGRSSLYKSAAMGCTDQPDFINAVISVETSLSPWVLLDDMQLAENDHGRTRLFANSPRTLDLDLLLYGDHIIKDERLVVPHQRMLSRAFVILPLLEISPELRLPDGYVIHNSVANIKNQSIKRFVDPRW